MLMATRLVLIATRLMLMAPTQIQLMLMQIHLIQVLMLQTQLTQTQPMQIQQTQIQLMQTQTQTQPMQSQQTQTSRPLTPLAMMQAWPQMLTLPMATTLPEMRVQTVMTPPPPHLGTPMRLEPTLMHPALMTLLHQAPQVSSSSLCVVLPNMC